MKRQIKIAMKRFFLMYAITVGWLLFFPAALLLAAIAVLLTFNLGTGKEVFEKTEAQHLFDFRGIRKEWRNV